MNIFKTSDKQIFKKLGKKVYIRNGVGYGFISDEYLYDNGFLEVGFGRVTSGYGDWGGGFDRVNACPLKIIINKDFEIQKVETDFFHNTSQKLKNKVFKIERKLKVGSKLNVKDAELKEAINSLFTVIPCKYHIGLDYFGHEHMLKYFLEGRDPYTNIREPKTL